MFLIGCIIFAVILFSVAAGTAAEGKKSAAGVMRGLAVAVLLVGAVSQTVRIIPAGHVGLIDLFGKVSDRTLHPGVNFVNPFANIIKMSVRTRELKETAQVPSKEGLSVALEVSLLYRLDPDAAAEVYRTVGPDYIDVVLVPQFRSVIRDVTALYEAKSLYTADRSALAAQIQEHLGKQVADRGILIEGTPLRRVALPERVTTAIEEKLKAEQESERMEFILRKERQEADRKRVEAEGIADFQEIVTKGISKELLQWKGIEATQELAKSSNSKIVVIGSGKDGLPIILGQ